MLFSLNLLKFKLNQLDKLYLFCMKEVDKLQAKWRRYLPDSFAHAVMLLGVIISNDL